MAARSRAVVLAERMGLMERVGGEDIVVTW